MKIALYYPWIYLKSGVEKTLMELVNRSAHEWTIFTSHYEPESTYPELKERGIIELPRIPVRRSFLSVSLAALKVMLQKINCEKFDILIVFSEGLGDFITFRNHKVPVICYCWTPLKVIHDPFARSAYLKNNKIKAPLFLLCQALFKLADRSAWKHYKHVFCCSDEVKKRVLRARLAAPEKIDVLHPGVDVEKIKPVWVYENYFFLPARIKWWKNIELSISAFKKFQEIAKNGKAFRLVIAGQVDKGSVRYYEKLRIYCAGNSDIEIIKNPSHDRFKYLYENCYAVLNTTLNEDWGLVVLEAMAYGKPVIAVNQGGPQEIIKNGQDGFLRSPTASGFAETMKALSKNKDAVLKIGRAAREESLRYGWDNFVRRIDDYLSKLSIC